MQVLLANPRGFCAGVDRAIEIVERALEKHGAPVYVRHEVVHNRVVVERLRKRGAVFVDDLNEVPPSATVIFSAHGVSRQVRSGADARELNVLDATCPLVTKVHFEVRQYRKRGLEVVLIGHAGHPEVEGTMGQADGGIYLVESAEDVARLNVRDPSRLAYVSQTTLSVDDTARIVEKLRARFPAITGPKKMTSVTPRKTARTRSNNLRANATSSSWSARRTVPIPTACARSPNPAARPRI